MGSDRKQQGKREQRISPWYDDQKVREVYIDYLSWRTSIQKKNGVREVSQVGTTHLGMLDKPGAPWCLVPTRVRFLEVFLFPKIFKYSKTDKKYFCGFFGVCLLTVSHTSLFSRFWSVPEGLFYVFFWCQSLDNITFNINGRTWDIMLYSLPIDNLRVSATSWACVGFPLKRKGWCSTVA